MLNTGLDPITDMNERLMIYGGIAAVIIIMSTAVFPFWNLFPRMTTEKVRVVYVDQTGCTVETSDGLIVKIPPCNAKAGDNITATYDAKIKERRKQI